MENDPGLPAEPQYPDTARLLGWRSQRFGPGITALFGPAGRRASSGISEPGLSGGAGARTRPADSHAAVDQTRPISFFAGEDVAAVHQHRCG